ncbi:MAG: hypothetical protein ACRCSN_21205 [Dermatophilaceae bacterium]
MNRQDRRARLAQALAEIAADTARSALAGVAWRSLGSCGARTDLPWTTDAADVSPWDAETMRATCQACPVLAECTAAAEGMTGGWWAGHDRDPDAEEPPAVSWVPIRSGRGHAAPGTAQGVLPLGGAA